MKRTKIEWADYTWNPIKGLCPQECSYCYARRMYQRLRLDPVLTLNATDPGLWRLSRGNRIFVCSTMEIFHPEVQRSWRNHIFKVIERYYWQTFIILTKRPERIDRPMPSNVWLGVSVTGPEDWWRVKAAAGAMARIRFISFEPLLKEILWNQHPELELFNWFIVGRLTGHGNKQDPTCRSVQMIVTVARLFGIPIFLKNNLRDVWGRELIQEFPKGKHHE